MFSMSMLPDLTPCDVRAPNQEKEQMLKFPTRTPLKKRREEEEEEEEEEGQKKYCNKLTVFPAS